MADFGIVKIQNNANKIFVVKIKNYIFDRIENIVKDGENAGNQLFLFFPTMFSELFFSVRGFKNLGL